jgi:multidrug transporter EmrE-like cation transporter
MSPFVFIGFSTVFGICGQLLLKRGMSSMSNLNMGGSMLRRMILSPWVWAGLVVYGSGVIFWLLALSHLELSYAYPFASLSYIGIIIGSYLIFKERITALRVLGIAVIIAGVLITSQS